MKQKKKEKKKYIDFDPDEYLKKQNNKSLSKKSNEEKNINNKNEGNQKIKFKNSLENLVFLYPNFSRDLIEDVYNENDQNFSRTKDQLKEMSKMENDENVINENEMHIEEEDQPKISKKNKKKKKYVDISERSNFEVVASDEPIENDKDKEKDIYNLEQVEEEKEKEIKKKESMNVEYNDYNNLILMKEKKGKEYSSVFENNDDNNIFMTPNIKEEPMIDDYLFDKNIEFLCDCFTEYKREEIVKKICDFNFDINNVVSNILNETYQNNIKNEENKNHLEYDEIEEILSKYENNENIQEDDDVVQIQKFIEDSIKSQNNIKKKNLYNDEDYDMEENDNNNQEKEEDFLGKNIDDIQTPQIKGDLKKLILNFPKEEEYNIKLAYFSFMDYQATFDFFDEKDGTKNLKLKSLINDMNKNNNKEIKHNKNRIKKNIKYRTEDEKRRLETMKKILEKKPINWNFEKEKNINEKDFRIIRNRLFKEARNCFANKKYSTGQILLNKARRYQQEIEQIARNRGISTFYNNNMYNNSKQIDLHGLTVDESKYIINSKIKILRNKKYEDNLKCISFTIITGIGSHSEGYKSVLFPELLPWLQGKEKLKANGQLNEGAIYVTIY